MQVLFQDGKFQWGRAEKLLGLAKEGSGSLDITSTVKDAVRVVLLDDKLRMQLVNAFTEDNRLHFTVSLLTSPFSMCAPMGKHWASNFCPTSIHTSGSEAISEVLHDMLLLWIDFH